LFDPGNLVFLNTIAAHDGTIVLGGQWSDHPPAFSSYLGIMRDDTIVASYFLPPSNEQDETLLAADFAPSGELYTVTKRYFGESRLTKYNANLQGIWAYRAFTDPQHEQFWGYSYATDVAATPRGAVLAGGTLPSELTQLDARGAELWRAPNCLAPCSDALVARVDDDTVLAARKGDIYRLELYWPEQAPLADGESCEEAEQCSSGNCCKPLGSPHGVCSGEEGCAFGASCEAADTCAGGVCSDDLGPASSYCTAACGTDADCGANAECVHAAGDEPRCFMACKAPEDCSNVFGASSQCTRHTDVDDVEVDVCRAPLEGAGGAGNP
jgi:hypothetical protein